MLPYILGPLYKHVHFKKKKPEKDLQCGRCDTKTESPANGFLDFVEIPLIFQNADFFFCKLEFYFRR